MYSRAVLSCIVSSFVPPSLYYSLIRVPVFLSCFLGEKSNFNFDYFCRYSTGLGVTGGSALIHEFYSREVPNPIHLTVDTGFTNGAGTIKAYVSNNLSLGERQIAAQFQEIPLDLRMVEAERIGCK